MNVLKRVKGANKRRRELDILTDQAFQIVFYAVALELHDKYGFGKKRVSELFYAMVSRIGANAEKYDPDCALTALKRDCKAILDLEVALH